VSKKVSLPIRKFKRNLIKNGKLTKRFRYMECKKNFMLMILSVSHRETEKSKKKNY